MKQSTKILSRDFAKRWIYQNLDSLGEHMSDFFRKYKMVKKPKGYSGEFVGYTIFRALVNDTLKHLEKLKYSDELKIIPVYKFEVQIINNPNDLTIGDVKRDPKLLDEWVLNN